MPNKEAFVPSVRIERETWDKIRALAKENDRLISDEVRRALRFHVARGGEPA